MSQSKQTRQILAHLSGQVGTLPEKKQPASTQSRGPFMLVLFAGNPIGLEETIQHLKRLKTEGWCFDFAFSSNAEALMNADRIIRQLQPEKVVGRNVKELSDYRMDHLTSVIVPLVTHNTARKVALGIQDGLLPNLLWQALWDGIPVYMNLDSLLTYHGRSTNNPAMNRMMASTIAELKAIGVNPLPSNTTSDPSGDQSAFLTAGSPGTRVITEKDILGLASHEKALNIYGGVIVTPLARDAAVARGIKIIRS